MSVKDCQNGDNCSQCSFNEIDNINNLDAVDYNITFKDNSNWYGGKDYILFLNKHCNIKSVCKRYKEGEV